ncbi:hypothetical protein IGL76_002657 [Enterococcus sp. DIV2381]
MIVCYVILIFFTLNAKAVELDVTKTEGTIRFYGIYEPVGKPSPPPPDLTSQKIWNNGPQNRKHLPRTNFFSSYTNFWIGLTLIILGYELLKRRNKT